MLFNLSHRSLVSEDTPKARGFSLIELLVVIAIIGLISMVILFQHRQFDSQLAMRNLAYEVALSIREAQSRGIGVRGVGADFSAAYGVRIQTGTIYRLYRDENDNKKYNSAELLNAYSIERGNRVTDICIDGVCGNTVLDITFKRPDPDATFVPAGSEAVIYLQSKNGTITRTVTVMATGQISVQ